MGWHVVFVAPPAPGHVYPSLPLVEQLVARGHRVTYVTSPSLAPVARSAGAAVWELDWSPETSGLAEGEFTVETLVADMDGMLTATRTALPGLLAALRREPPRLICSDSVPLGPLLASIFGAPLVALMSTFATNDVFPPTELVPGFDPAHPALVDYFTRVGALFADHQVPATGPGTGPAAGLTLVFVPREFQIAADSFDASYHFIGPSLPEHARGADWTPPGRGRLLLVSLGTAFNNRPEFFTTVVDAFAGTDWHVVMVTGEHIDPAAIEPIPPNIHPATTVPQLAVLPHAAAFVSHAGMGSTMEALHYQVPVVAVPHAREQQIIAARIQELGLGQHLQAHLPTAAQLRRAVEQASGDPRIRANLAGMKRSLDAAGGASAGADAIERYLRR